MAVAYRDSKWLVCKGSQTVSFGKTSDALEASWSTAFEIKYSRPDRLLYWYGMKEDEGTGIDINQIALANSSGIYARNRETGRKETAKTIVDAVTPPSYGEGPMFILELLFADGWTNSRFSFPSLQHAPRAAVAKREEYKGVPCYVLSIDTPGINLWYGGTATVWVSTDRFMLQRVLVDGTVGPGNSKTRRESVFKYDFKAEPKEEDFKWPDGLVDDSRRDGVEPSRSDHNLTTS